MDCRFALFALAFSTPLFAEDTNPLIIGGNDASGDWPWAARVEVGPATCSGSLLHESWVITAAHCLFGGNGEQVDAATITVYVGSGRKGTNPNRGSSGYHVHPDYNNNAEFIGHDIALIRLNTPITVSALPSLVDDEHFTDLLSLDVNGRDEAVTAIGWGVTNPEEPAVSDKLQQVALDYVPFSDCNQRWKGHLGEIENSVLCASELNPEDGQHQSTCFGDSGGPLILSDTPSAFIVGLTSFGVADSCQASRPSVLNRVINMVDFVESSSALVDVALESEQNRYYGAPSEQILVPASVHNASVNASNDASNVIISADVDNAAVETTLQWNGCASAPPQEHQCTLSSLPQGSRDSGQVALSINNTTDTAANLALAVRSNEGEYRSANNQKSIKAIFSDKPDLAVTTKQTAGYLDSDGQGVATIAVHVSNLSTINSANDATLELALPVGTTARGDDSVQCDTLCRLGPMDGGASADFTLTLTSGAPEAGTLTLTTADQNGGDFPLDNNQYEQTVTYASPVAVSGNLPSGSGGGALGAWLLLALAGLTFWPRSSRYPSG